MDALYRLREGSAAEVVAELDSNATFDSIRVTLGILKKKGHVKGRRNGNQNLYSPKVPRAKARKEAIQHLLHTFFDNDCIEAIAAIAEFVGMTPREVRDVLHLSGLVDSRDGRAASAKKAAKKRKASKKKTTTKKAAGKKAGTRKKAKPAKARAAKKRKRGR